MKAIQACQQCRRRKRKCNRDKPSCAFCVRLGISCEYIFPQSPSTTSSGAVNQFRQAQNGVTGTPNGPPMSLSAFPFAFFIDPDYFVQLPNDAAGAPSPSLVPLVSQALSLLDPNWVAICQSYNSTVNRWLSVMSPQRLHQDILSTQAIAGACNPTLTLLLSSVQIVCDTNYRGVCPAYTVAKSLSSALENEGIVSLRLLQSTILLALYELGHAIYPCAYITIGRAARLAMLMGLQNKQADPQLYKPADSLTKREEERRAWWAVFVLDRFCNSYNTSLALAIPEPQPNLPLPFSDMGWQDGQTQEAEPEQSIMLASLTSNPDSIGRFATLCQASHLLSLVIKHRNSGNHPPVIDISHELLRNDITRLDEALQLHRTLVALDGRIVLPPGPSPEIPENADALAVVCLARFILYNLYGCSEPDVRSGLERLRIETEMQRESVKGIMHMSTTRVPQIAGLITNRAAATSAETGRSIGVVFAQCFYHTATECAWFVREGSGPEMRAGLNLMISALRQIAHSWDVANKYLELLGSDETAAGAMADHPLADAEGP